jgi:hypothetical protein
VSAIQNSVFPVVWSIFQEPNTGNPPKTFDIPPCKFRSLPVGFSGKPGRSAHLTGQLLGLGVEDCGAVMELPVLVV